MIAECSSWALMRSLIAVGCNYPTSVVPTTMVLDRRHRVAAVI